MLHLCFLYYVLKLWRLLIRHKAPLGPPICVFSYLGVKNLCLNVIIYCMDMNIIWVR